MNMFGHPNIEHMVDDVAFCPDNEAVGMRGLRVLFVENDAALLGLLAVSLRAHPAIDSVITAGSSDDALAENISMVDVALLDVGLGSHSLSGIELGLELRARNSNIGIVLYSQLISASFTDSLPQDSGYGWSMIQKSADLSIDYLVNVLNSTAKGLNIIDPKVRLNDAGVTVGGGLGSLTTKQRQIMALAASGLDAVEIANQLGFAPVTIRQDLSKVYRVLVPNPKPGTDLRTTAVLNYLRESRSTEFNV